MTKKKTAAPNNNDNRLCQSALDLLARSTMLYPTLLAGIKELEDIGASLGRVVCQLRDPAARVLYNTYSDAVERLVADAAARAAQRRGRTVTICGAKDMELMLPKRSHHKKPAATVASKTVAPKRTPDRRVPTQIGKSDTSMTRLKLADAEHALEKARRLHRARTKLQAEVDRLRQMLTPVTSRN